MLRASASGRAAAEGAPDEAAAAASAPGGGEGKDDAPGSSNGRSGVLNDAAAAAAEADMSLSAGDVGDWLGVDSGAASAASAAAPQVALAGSSHARLWACWELSTSLACSLFPLVPAQQSFGSRGANWRWWCEYGFEAALCQG